MSRPFPALLEPISVTGMGLVSALGSTKKATWERLIAGSSGLEWYAPFPELPVTLLGMVDPHPASAQALLKTALKEALMDANLDADLPTATGVVIGSSRGNQMQMEVMGCERQKTSFDQDVHLHNWLQVYSQSPSHLVAKALSIQGPILAPRTACATGLWAIAQGAELIRNRHCELVIAGAVEAPITPLTLAGFRKMGALSQEGLHPFDHRRTGFILGEGAAIFVLESQNRAKRRSQIIYGNLLGFGATADAFHVSAPCDDRQIASLAIKRCLQYSHSASQDIDAIHAHGTGTSLNDAAEADIIETLFPHQPWVTSTKGATGHTLGASGAFGAAFSLLALHHQIFPPCTGLQSMDPAFNLNLSSQAIKTQLNNILCFSFGFGGQNAAIAISRNNTQ